MNSWQDEQVFLAEAAIWPKCVGCWSLACEVT